MKWPVLKNSCNARCMDWQHSIQYLNRSVSSSILLLVLIYAKPITAQQSSFIVLKDSLVVDFRSVQKPGSRIYISHMTVYQNRWYCVVVEQDLYSYKESQHRAFIINMSGKIISETPLPTTISERGYLDLFVRNEKLYIQPYMEDHAFVFEPISETWQKIKKRTMEVFEDEKFHVHYVNNGEWGEYSYFVDRKTKKQYVLPHNCTKLTEFKGKYYATTGMSIIEIADPKMLTPCPRKSKIGRRKRWIIYPQLEAKGFEYVYNDTTDYPLYSKFDPKFWLYSSWKKDDELFHLYTDSTQLYVGKLESGQITPLLCLGPKLKFVRSHYAYRGQNPTNEKRLLVDDQLFKVDLMQIDGKNLHLQHWELLIDTLFYTKEPGLDDLLAVLKRGNVQNEVVASYENRWQGTRLAIDRKGIQRTGYHKPNNVNDRFSTNSYIKVLDSYIALESEYVYRESDSVLVAIFMEWKKTQPYIDNYIFDLFDDRCDKAARFDSLQFEIFNLLSKNFGPPSDTLPEGMGDFQYKWSMPNNWGLRYSGIHDYQKTQNIRMYFYLKDDES